MVRPQKHFFRQTAGGVCPDNLPQDAFLLFLMAEPHRRYVGKPVAASLIHRASSAEPPRRDLHPQPFSRLPDVHRPVDPGPVRLDCDVEADRRVGASLPDIRPVTQQRFAKPRDRSGPPRGHSLVGSDSGGHAHASGLYLGLVCSS